MSKFLIFSLLWYVTGNPFIALLVLLGILYFLDRRFIGLTPSIFRPFTLRRRLSQLEQDVKLNPHNRSARQEQARVLIELKRYAQAKQVLSSLREGSDESADVEFDYGFSSLKRGEYEEAEKHLLRALELNPRVRFGEPYLRLGEAAASLDPQKAIAYLQQFQEQHSSSVEAYYRMGQLYKQLGQADSAKQAFREAVEVYRMLPAYKKRTERRYALLARFQG